jgi:hypothetical protein
MKEYNIAFFALYENLYKILKEEYGENQALYLFRKIMVTGLQQAYDNFGFNKGEPQSFAATLKARDNAVGLLVKFPEIAANKIVYQFFTDPFPNLKNQVAHDRLDDTYLRFKVKYLLGDNWTYTTTKHFWDGDPYTEFTITKI